MVHLRLIQWLLLIVPLAVYGQTPWWLLKNTSTQEYVLKVDSNLPAGDGFGFVIAERADTFYVATAKHVVYDEREEDFASVIWVAFDGGKDSITATGYSVSAQHDFALIKVPVTNSMLWPYRSIISSPREHAKVGLIGIRRNWNPTTMSLRGTILEVGEDSIHTDLRSIIRGCSGGPLLDNRGIVGMIISSNPNGAGGAAIPIDLIKTQCLTWLGGDAKPGRDLPYLQVGIDLDISFPISFTNKVLPFMTGKEIYGHMAITPMVRLRYGYSFFKSHSRKADTTRYDFRNRFGAHTVGFSYDLVKNTHPMTGSISAGTYFITNINPELKEDDTWMPFDQVSNYRGQDRSMGWYLDGSAEVNFKFGMAINIGISIKYFQDRYLVIKPNDPLGQDQDRKVLLGFGLGASYKLGYRHKNDVIVLR